MARVRVGRKCKWEEYFLSSLLCPRAGGRERSVLLLTDWWHYSHGMKVASWSHLCNPGGKKHVLGCYLSDRQVKSTQRERSDFWLGTISLLHSCSNFDSHLMDHFHWLETFHSGATSVAPTSPWLLWEIIGFVVQQVTNSIRLHRGSSLYSLSELWCLLAVHVYLRMSSDFGACYRTWPEVLFNLFFFPPFGEVFEVFFWIRGASCLVFLVHMGMFIILAWQSAVEVPQSCTYSPRPDNTCVDYPLRLRILV